jgi:uncharacterized protein (DUF488 family)
VLDERAPRVWSVGHSTRTFDAFLGLVREHRIEIVADIRRYPSSQRAPWATRAGLEASLSAAAIGYVHLEDLGGRRRPRTDSANRGWRSEAFRGYADHMGTAPFGAALDRLLGLAAVRRVAILCAEAVPWRCHRSLLSDALLARGGRVTHILGPGQCRDHRLTPFANVRGGRVTYPGGRATSTKAHKAPSR